MDLRTEIKQQIQQIASANHGARQGGTVQIDVPDGGQISAQLNSVQSLGCELIQLDIRTPHAQQWSTDRLQEIGRNIADRIHYLLEPLQLHEVDAHNRAAQVRSAPPQREGKTIRYFEVTAQAPDGLRMTRYEKSPGSTRRVVPAVVTVEVLAQLCQDIRQIAHGAAALN